MGSSRARFKEAAKRDGIHHQMDLLQRKIEDRQKYLWDNFQVRARHGDDLHVVAVCVYPYS